MAKLRDRLPRLQRHRYATVPSNEPSTLDLTAEEIFADLDPDWHLVTMLEWRRVDDRDPR